jgi:hypothetical protein
MLGRLGGGLAAAVLFMAAVGNASAQVPDATRDCQTLLKCNYAKGGSFRGCISAYTCKTCRFVPAKCTVAGERRCHKMQCGWG